MELQSWPSPGQHAELQLHGRGVCARSNIHLWKVHRGCSLLPLISASVWILSAKPSGRKSPVIRSVHVCTHIYNHTHTVAKQCKERHAAHNVNFRIWCCMDFYTRYHSADKCKRPWENWCENEALSCPLLSLLYQRIKVWSLKLPWNHLFILNKTKIPRFFFKCAKNSLRNWLPTKNTKKR